MRHPISAIGVTAETAEKCEELLLSVHRKQFWAFYCVCSLIGRAVLLLSAVPVLSSRADESSTQKGFVAAENTFTAAASSAEVNSNCRRERKSL